MLECLFITVSTRDYTSFHSDDHSLVRIELEFAYTLSPRLRKRHSANKVFARGVIFTCKPCTSTGNSRRYDRTKNEVVIEALIDLQKVMIST